MAKFIALVSHKGAVPADYADQPAPDPAMFGLPTEDDGSRDDLLLGQNMISCTHYEHDFDALRAGVDPDRPRRRRRVRGRAGPSRRASPWPSGSARRRSPSRAATAGSSAASTARRVSPRRSPSAARGARRRGRTIQPGDPGEQAGRCPRPARPRPGRRCPRRSSRRPGSPWLSRAAALGSEAQHRGGSGVMGGAVGGQHVERRSRRSGSRHTAWAWFAAWVLSHSMSSCGPCRR